MPGWEERIDRSTDSALIAEHVARYRFAMPVIRNSAVWVDLGCGNGVAARDALAGSFEGNLMLVDSDATALAAASEELSSSNPEGMLADLSSSADLERMEDRIPSLDTGADGCITCFETVEHLPSFPPLLQLLTRLSAARLFTVILSVPNDEFWSIHNPHHQTTWGDGALAEFRSLLPEAHVAAMQFPLAGTCIQPEAEEQETEHQVSVPVAADRIPSHFLLSFGPGLDGPTAVAACVQVDLDQRRAWERQREADLAFLRQRESDLVYYAQEAEELRQELRTLRDANDKS
jgi:Methyltransferase small domain